MNKSFSYRDGSFYLNDRPYTVISGAIHYFRTLPDCWEDRLTKLKACGFNTVENGMKLGCNHPMGPLELADMIGLDVLLNVMNVMSTEIGSKYHPSMTLRKMVTSGFLGRKSGAGFYIYENGKKMGVNPVLTQIHSLTK